MSNEENEHKNAGQGGDEKSTPEIRYVPVDIRRVEEEENEIDLVDILRTLWDGRKTVYKTVAVFTIAGLIVALFSVEEYTAEVKVLPASQEGMSLGGIGGLAQQFGFSSSVPQSGDGFSANLYPSIIQSNGFIKELMEHEVPLPNGGDMILLKEYMSIHQSSSPVISFLRMPFRLKNWLFSSLRNEPSSVDNVIANQEQLSGLVRMSDEDWETLRKIRERLTTSIDTDTGLVTVSVDMQDPVVAAEIADEVVKKLSEYIREKRTEKARQDVEFIEERFNEAKDRFEEAQQELAAFNDANRGQLTAMARTEEQLLQSRYNLNFNLYNSLAERLEEARINLQEETPVINIIEPASIPDRRSAPNRTLILVVFVALGGMIGIGICFGAPLWKGLKSEMKK